ncbi:MAG: helix-turn-helix domain-containing protein [Anaerolineae bacterium]|nr:helix-turn-helix domain-containing protein [Anaerolineae bacterium]
MNEQALDQITISDLLRLALPLNTTTLGGAEQARRTVEWVVLLTSWDAVEDQVQVNDLVIVPPSLQAKINEAALKQKMAVVAKLNAAGMVLFSPVSEDVGEQANRLNVPILIVPDNLSVREINRAVAALLVDRQSATSERGMQLYRTLSEMSREDQGLTAMTELIAKLTGKIAVVQDKRMEIQAVALPQNNQIEWEPLRELLEQRDELPPVLRNRKAAAHARQSHWQQFFPIENLGRLVSPIISGDRARGYLSVIGPADKLDLLDKLAVEHGAAACALEMAKAKAISEAKKALRGNFLEGLLAGTMPRKEIERLEGRLDHNTNQPHAVLVLKWADPPAYSLRRLETTIHWVLNNHSRAALVHVYGDKHVCVFQELKHAEDMESAQELGRRIEEQVKTEYPDAVLVAGMSGPAPTLAEWPKVYDEALQAMQLGERLQIKQVVPFSSLGVYQLLVQMEEHPAVRNFTDQVIGPLVEYDDQHNSSLVKTMDAYFEHHGNISQTAESLFIHRNTLLYRLDRIQELTGHDLNQSNMRLALHLALKLWQLRP